MLLLSNKLDSYPKIQFSYLSQRKFLFTKAIEAFRKRYTVTPNPGCRPPKAFRPIYYKSHSYTTSIVPRPRYMPVSPNPPNIFAIRAPFSILGWCDFEFVCSHSSPAPSHPTVLLVSLPNSRPLLYARAALATVSASEFSFFRDSQAKMKKTTTVFAFRVSRVSSRPPPQPKREIGHLQSSTPPPTNPGTVPPHSFPQHFAIASPSSQPVLHNQLIYPRPTNSVWNSWHFLLAHRQQRFRCRVEK